MTLPLMHTVILAMRRRPVAQSLMAALDNEPGIRAVCEPDYSRMPEAAAAYEAEAALLEVAETGPYNADFCLALCDAIRKEAPGCKAIILCPEHDETCVSAVLEGKNRDRLDDFLFCDASTGFLVAKLLTVIKHPHE